MDLENKIFAKAQNTILEDEAVLVNLDGASIVVEQKPKGGIRIMVATNTGRTFMPMGKESAQRIAGALWGAIQRMEAAESEKILRDDSMKFLEEGDVSLAQYKYGIQKLIEEKQNMIFQRDMSEKLWTDVSAKCAPAVGE